MSVLQELLSSRRTGKKMETLYGVSCSEADVMITEVGNPQHMIHTLDPMPRIHGDFRNQEHVFATPYFFRSVSPRITFNSNENSFCCGISIVQ